MRRAMAAVASTDRPVAPETAAQTALDDAPVELVVADVFHRGRRFPHEGVGEVEKVIDGMTER